MLMTVLNYILIGIIASSSNIYAWSKLLDKSINIKKFNYWVVFLFNAIFVQFNYYFVNQYIKIILITIIFCVNVKLLFKESLKNCIIVTIYAQILSVVCELSFAFIVLSFNSLTTDEIINSQFGTLFTNLIISMFLVILSSIKISRKIYLLLLKATSKLKLTQVTILFFVLILFVNIILAVPYYESNLKYVVIVSELLIIFSFIVILYCFKTKNSYIKVYGKYNTTLSLLKEYEDILDKYRISNHENKNQLLTIRNMLKSKDKKIIDYIDNISNNKLKDDEKIMLETYCIPTGGLRGLIYSKILVMKNYNINYNLNISRDVKVTKFIEQMEDVTMLDVCRALGVFIDNSIDEVKKLPEKYINIDFYLEDLFLVICISNNYESRIDIEKISNGGYTTKGDGHGYGLTLVKQIIENNKNLYNETKISKEVFTQIIKININN